MVVGARSILVNVDMHVYCWRPYKTPAVMALRRSESFIVVNFDDTDRRTDFSLNFAQLARLYSIGGNKCG